MYIICCIENVAQENVVQENAVQVYVEQNDVDKEMLLEQCCTEILHREYHTGKCCTESIEQNIIVHTLL